MPISIRETSNRASFARKLNGAAGLTLLELAVVLFIVGLLTLITLPRLRDRDRSELEASATRLVVLARYLSEEAALRGATLRLNYDLDVQRCFVTVLDSTLEEPDFVPDSSPLATPVILPDSVMIADVAVASAERLTGGVALTHFYPEGYADPTIVHLRGRGGDYATVMIEPLSGNAVAYADRLEAEDLARGM